MLTPSLDIPYLTVLLGLIIQRSVQNSDSLISKNSMTKAVRITVDFITQMHLGTHKTIIFDKKDTTYEERMTRS